MTNLKPDFGCCGCHGWSCLPSHSTQELLGGYIALATSLNPQAEVVSRTDKPNRNPNPPQFDAKGVSRPVFFCSPNRPEASFSRRETRAQQRGRLSPSTYTKNAYSITQNAS